MRALSKPLLLVKMTSSAISILPPPGQISSDVDDDELELAQVGDGETEIGSEVDESIQCIGAYV